MFKTFRLQLLHLMMTISSELSRSQLLSPSELLERWQSSLYPVSNVTLTRWRREGRGPAFVKIGAAGRIYYKLDSVKDYEFTHNIGISP